MSKKIDKISDKNKKTTRREIKPILGTGCVSQKTY